MVTFTQIPDNNTPLGGAVVYAFACDTPQTVDLLVTEAESGTLTFTVPQELEEQEIRLNLTLLTEDGEQWQGFSQENSENSWVPGQTYTAQIDGLEQMVVLCNLGGVSMSSSVGFTAEKGYQGIGMSNLPQG